MRTALTRLALAAAIVAGCAPPQPVATPDGTQPGTVTATTTASQTQTSSAASPRTDGAPVVAQGPVVSVVDGDTVDLADARVRLAIVDTPEVHGGTEPCGPEASAFTRRFLDGQTVAVYRPSDAPQTGPYGRTIGEVVRLSDGTSLNVALHREGLAAADGRYADEDPDLAARLGDVTPDDPGC